MKYTGENASDLPRHNALQSYWIDPAGTLMHAGRSHDEFARGVGKYASDLIREGWVRVNVSPSDNQILFEGRLTRVARQVLEDLSFSQRMEVVRDDGTILFKNPDKEDLEEALPRKDILVGRFPLTPGPSARASGFLLPNGRIIASNNDSDTHHADLVADHPEIFGEIDALTKSGRKAIVDKGIVWFVAYCSMSNAPITQFIGRVSPENKARVNKVLWGSRRSKNESVVKLMHAPRQVVDALIEDTFFEPTPGPYKFHAPLESESRFEHKFAELLASKPRDDVPNIYWYADYIAELEDKTVYAEFSDDLGKRHLRCIIKVGWNGPTDPIPLDIVSVGETPSYRLKSQALWDDSSS